MTAPASPKRYQVIAAALAKAIGDGVYGPGDRLPSERDLAEQFKVSRPTVREAIIALDIQGLIETRHGSGIYVTALLQRTKEPVELDIGAFELTEARRLFEGEAAALAAAAISEEELAELAQLLEGIRDENQRNIPGEMADRAFHLAIARATRNSAIVEVIERLWNMRNDSPLCREILARAREVGVQPRVDEHERILEALRARDPHAARKAMRDHLERVIEGLLKATEMVEMEKARSDLEARRTFLKQRISI